MRIKLDPDVYALYITFHESEVARTIDIAEMAYADLDEDGEPLDLDFVNADDFVPFMRDHAVDANVQP